MYMKMTMILLSSLLYILSLSLVRVLIASPIFPPFSVVFDGVKSRECECGAFFLRVGNSLSLFLTSVCE